MEAFAKAGENKNCELRKILDEVSPKNFEKMNKLLGVKDEEIAKLKDEIKIMSAQWKLKTKGLESQVKLSWFAGVILIHLFSAFMSFLEAIGSCICFKSQLEKQRRADQELKKKVLKLEFCLQEARSQTRKLQRVNLAIVLCVFWLNLLNK